jgi:hypothetical protein
VLKIDDEIITAEDADDENHELIETEGPNVRINRINRISSNQQLRPKSSISPVAGASPTPVPRASSTALLVRRPSISQVRQQSQQQSTSPLNSQMSMASPRAQSQQQQQKQSPVSVLYIFLSVRY